MMFRSSFGSQIRALILAKWLDRFSCLALVLIAASVWLIFSNSVSEIQNGAEMQGLKIFYGQTYQAWFIGLGTLFIGAIAAFCTWLPVVLAKNSERQISIETLRLAKDSAKTFLKAVKEFKSNADGTEKSTAGRISHLPALSKAARDYKQERALSDLPSHIIRRLNISGIYRLCDELIETAKTIETHIDKQSKDVESLISNINGTIDDVFAALTKQIG